MYTEDSRAVRCFTLIELLVVIAIIAILAAMLMPALERARNAAMQAKCLSKQKQIGLAMAMYHNDWDGYSPVAVYTDLPAAWNLHNPWDLVLAYHYMGVDRSESWWFPRASDSKWRPEVMRCRKTVAEKWWKGTYSLNRMACGGKLAWKDSAIPYQQFIQKARDIGKGPSDLALMFEGWNAVVVSRRWNYLTPQFEHRHPEGLQLGTGQNILFADFHAEFKRANPTATTGGDRIWDTYDIVYGKSGH